MCPRLARRRPTFAHSPCAHSIPVFVITEAISSCLKSEFMTSRRVEEEGTENMGSNTVGRKSTKMIYFRYLFFAVGGIYLSIVCFPAMHFDRASLSQKRP